MVKGITYILINNAEVQALVGRNKANTKYKAYPVICPHPETWPYSVVRQTGRTKFGDGKCAGSTWTYSYDVYSFHKNYEEAEALDIAVVEALDLFSGGTHNGVVFQEIRPTNTGRDIDFVVDHNLYGKVSSFEAEVNEN
jgi:hypothetical protein